MNRRVQSWGRLEGVYLVNIQTFCIKRESTNGAATVPGYIGITYVCGTYVGKDTPEKKTFFLA